MASPFDGTLIHIDGLRKQFGGLRPLRVNALSLKAGERVTLSGLDAAAAEMLALLVTGASVPDEGTVWIAGRDTREIATDTEWLSSLDLFGMVSSRAVLLDSLPLQANLALPFTLSIEPVPPEIQERVSVLAEEVGLPASALPRPVHELPPADLVRVHLARALAPDPKVLLLEHPTAVLEPAEAARLGAQIAAVADRRGLGWLAVSADAAFRKALGGRHADIAPASGAVTWQKEWTVW